MVLSMDRWVGKVAIVTAATSGIGAATVEALVHQGLVVVGLAKRKEQLNELAENLSGKKGQFFAVKADMRHEQDIIYAFKWVKENLGPVHILINNAGTSGTTNLTDGDAAIWKNILTINVLSLSIATREAIRDMRSNNVDGHIIHINSVTGHQIYDLPDLNMYPASKYAVTALAETLRLELMRLKLKIKITSLSPGPVDTELIPDSIKAKVQKSGSRQFIEAENIAEAVIYVLSTPPHVQVQELTIRSVDESMFKEF